MIHLQENKKGISRKGWGSFDAKNSIKMLTKIRKRDGRIVPFKREKIRAAIEKAFRATHEAAPAETAAQLTNDVIAILLDQLAPKQIPSVEGVQDVVERVLIKHNYAKTAKAYILYRRQHEELRKIKGLVGNVANVERYLQQTDWRVKENANMSYSLQGLNFHVASFVISQYWLDKIYPQEIRTCHVEGDFHLHDLAVLGPYCVGWDLKDLLLKGFRGVKGKLHSGPPKHLGTALNQLVNFLFTLQGEAAGAQAVSNFDTLLAPFVRADKLSYKEIKQAMQNFIFNMNVPTRVGFQTPFSNLTLDLKVPEFMENEPAIVGGKPQESYGSYQKEIELINRAFSEIMLEGDAKNRVFSFPIPTYNITKEFDWDNEIYNGIWKMTAKYGIPYFANFINSDMKPEDVRSMCCRLRLDNRELRKRGGGLFGANPLTGSIGVVTINLARLGLLGTETKFFERLEELMDYAKESLETKRKVLEKLTEQGLYPYTKFYLRGIKAVTGNYWTNHFSTIGLVGMNEACLNLFGQDLTNKEAAAFAEKVLVFMRQKLQSYQEETNHPYNLEATPAESTSYRLARIDRKKFPNANFGNNEAVKKGAEPYYTNSTQLPVGFNDLFTALKIQDPLQTKYTGGTVFHVYIGEQEPSTEGVKQLIRKICSSFRMPYITITPTFSVCPQHGYLFGKHFRCPKCMVPCEVYSRIVGYIRPVSQWNYGKQAEFKERKHFDEGKEIF